MPRPARNDKCSSPRQIGSNFLHETFSHENVCFRFFLKYRIPPFMLDLKNGVWKMVQTDIQKNRVVLFVDVRGDPVSDNRRAGHKLARWPHACHYTQRHHPHDGLPHIYHQRHHIRIWNGTLESAAGDHTRAKSLIIPSTFINVDLTWTNGLYFW